jgi:hypothetical protein
MLVTDYRPGGPASMPGSVKDLPAYYEGVQRWVAWVEGQSLYQALSVRRQGKALVRWLLVLCSMGKVSNCAELCVRAASWNCAGCVWHGMLRFDLNNVLICTLFILQSSAMCSWTVRYRSAGASAQPAGTIFRMCQHVTPTRWYLLIKLHGFMSSFSPLTSHNIY